MADIIQVTLTIEQATVLTRRLGGTKLEDIKTEDVAPLYEAYREIKQVLKGYHTA